MDHKPFDCKPFDSGDPAPGAPRPLLDRLLGRTQILLNESDDDLREMCKTHEVANLYGLAAHPIERPLPADWDPAVHLHARSEKPELALQHCSELARLINMQPMICVRGFLAGASKAALPVEIYAPLPGAHMAMAAKALLWPERPQETFKPGMQLLIWHERIAMRRGSDLADRLIGYWPRAGFALTVGYDDPSLIADILWDKAQRVWEQETGIGRIVEEQGRLVVINDADGNARFIHEENPSTADWLASLDTMLEEKHAGETLMTPVWANPILPADCLAAGPEWRDAALSVGSLPFGVNINQDGQFPPFDNIQPEGWIIIPRESLPAPMPKQLRQYQLQ